MVMHFTVLKIEVVVVLLPQWYKVCVHHFTQMRAMETYPQ